MNNLITESDHFAPASTVFLSQSSDQQGQIFLKSFENMQSRSGSWPTKNSQKWTGIQKLKNIGQIQIDRFSNETLKRAF